MFVGDQMRFLVTACLLLISLPLTAAAQRSKAHPPLSRAQIREAEAALSRMGYWTGAVDGRFDPATRSALIAFQKYVGRSITGQLTLDELEAIRGSASPGARERGYAHVEVDVDRQVLLFVSDDGRVRVLPVSTGNDQQFAVDDQISIAYTPRGRFLVYEKEVGWGKGPLGAMYYSNFITGGVAIHGSPSVPTQPVSHGCIRIPMFAARDVSKLMPVGTIVLVYDKVSFVSAKSWAENPRLRQAALLTTRADASDYTYETDGTKTNSKSVIIKKARLKIIRA
jgi:peptidoglycan hydrolase-like protein with peptidoglycan-binding domain